MVKTTRAQRQALKRKLDQQVSSYVEALKRGERPPLPPTYRQFRATIMPEFGGGGCILVRWCGMTLGIETDGYCHS